MCYDYTTKLIAFGRGNSFHVSFLATNKVSEQMIFRQVRQFFLAHDHAHASLIHSVNFTLHTLLVLGSLRNGSIYDRPENWRHKICFLRSPTQHINVIAQRKMGTNWSTRYGSERMTKHAEWDKLWPSSRMCMIFAVAPRIHAVTTMNCIAFDGRISTYLKILPTSHVAHKRLVWISERKHNKRISLKWDAHVVTPFTISSI